MKFQLFSRTGKTLPETQFSIRPISTVHPYEPLGASKTGKSHEGAPYLKGRISTVSQPDGLVDFTRVFFTNGTSELPNGKLHLLVRSEDPRITPYLIENVCVRSKRIKIREDVTEREKREELFQKP